MNGAYGREDHSTQKALAARWTIAAEAMEALAGARSLDAVVAVLRAFARRAVGADGIAVVLRDGDKCHYIAEDAKAPLWAGQRFPAETCVSGWAMLNQETAVIADIFDDVRVPVDAYSQTFVRSMIMVPIGRVDPIAAVGAYWSEPAMPTDNEISLLEALARAASTALENGRLFSALESLNDHLDQRVRERTSELESAQDKLRQIQKMDVLGQLTGHVAHDFNNLLTPIIGGLDQIIAGGRSPEAVARTANIAMQAAETAQTLVKRLLAFGRRQPLQPTSVNLSETLENMQTLLVSTVGPQIILHVDAAPDVPAVRADRHQLELAILNLVVNARDAMPNGGQVIISAERCKSRLPVPLIPGQFVCLRITDTGIGMTPAVKASATEPFFTTKPVGHGTGLGLSMAHGLAGQLGGALEIVSEVGQGTEVQLWLPIEKQKPVAIVADGDGGEITATQGKVLLIDDNALVRHGTREMLTDLGYDVVDIDNAELGLSMIAADFRPDIVVTDHIMPGMTGAELALRLRVDHPEIALLIISGYEGVDLIAPDIPRLSKPFRRQHLQASIAAAQAQTVGRA